MMSTNLKITILALVLVLIGSGIWWIVSIPKSTPNNLTQQNNEEQATTDSQNNQPNGTNGANQQPASVSNNSDASIDSSLNIVDAEITGMSSDADYVDQSLVE